MSANSRVDFGAIVSDTPYATDQLAAEVVRSVTVFSAMREEWNSLLLRTGSRNAFLTHEWLSTWFAQFGETGSLFVVAVRLRGRLIALAPLYLRRRFAGLSCLGFIGSRYVGSDHLEFLVDPEYRKPALSAICDAIMRHKSEWSYVEFDGVDRDSMMSDVASQLRTANALQVVEQPSSVCPYITLPETPELYLASLGKRVRDNFKYYSRLTRRDRQVDFVEAREPGDVLSAYDDLLRLHSARFKEVSQQSAFLSPKVRDFHRAVVKKLARCGIARIFTLQFEGQAVGALYAFSVQGRMMFYQSGIEPEHSRLRLGTVLLGSTICWAIENGHTEFDFLRGDESYKAHWSNGARSLVTIRLFDQRPVGRFAHFAHSATQVARKWKKSLSPATKQTLS